MLMPDAVTGSIDAWVVQLPVWWLCLWAGWCLGGAVAEEVSVSMAVVMRV